jgi:hypothetical protein
MVAFPLRVVLAACVVLAGAGLSAGAVPTAEDLTGCKLPNGRAVLPLAGAAQAAGGSMYKFATNALSGAPMSPEGKPLATDEVLAKVRDAKAADLEFVPENKGSLWAFSGCIADVPGAVLLAEAGSHKLEAPSLIRKTSRNTEGLYNDVQEGAVYIVKTTDNKYALVRVLEKTGAAVVIQYVYQPDGTLKFDIPANAMIPYQASAGAAIAGTNPAPAAPAAAGGTAGTRPASGSVAASVPSSPRIVAAAGNPPKPLLGPGDINEPGRIVVSGPSVSAAAGGGGGATAGSVAMEAFTKQRAQLLQIDKGIIAAPVRTEADMDRKAQAAAELAALHADEPDVADLLVANISFVATGASVREFSGDAFLPCFAALKRMGAVGTAAALKGLRGLDLDGQGTGTDSPQYKAVLLSRVVRGVEGDDVAEFIFKREAEKETNAKRKAVFEYVVEKR